MARLGTGDARPAPIRPDGLIARQFPSRIGDRLTWPDGRITTLDGGVLASIELPTPPTDKRTTR